MSIMDVGMKLVMAGIWIYIFFMIVKPFFPHLKKFYDYVKDEVDERISNKKGGNSWLRI